jgi:hypothetical protein
VAWTESGWHGSWFFYGLAQSSSEHNLAHQMRAATYNDSPTPDPDPHTQSRYGGSSYLAGEVFSAPGWPAGGTDMSPVTVAAVGDLVVVVAGPVASAGPVTMTPYGSMIYDSEAAGARPLWSFMYHYFGGPVAAREGSFTIQWSADGLGVITVPVAAAAP